MTNLALGGGVYILTAHGSMCDKVFQYYIWNLATVKPISFTKKKTQVFVCLGVGWAWRRSVEQRGEGANQHFQRIQREQQGVWSPQPATKQSGIVRLKSRCAQLLNEHSVLSPIMYLLNICKGCSTKYSSCTRFTGAGSAKKYVVRPLEDENIYKLRPKL